jgi:hypothetical protein
MKKGIYNKTYAAIREKMALTMFRNNTKKMDMYEQTGVDRVTFNQMLSGKRRVSLPTIIRFCDYHKIKLSNFFKGVDVVK